MELKLKKAQGKKGNQINNSFSDFTVKKLNYARNNIVNEARVLYRNSLFLFPEYGFDDNAINLESRRYIGSKAKLTDWILKVITSRVDNASSFFDVFAGTACVAKSASAHFNKIIINDILYSNNVIYKAFFEPAEWNYYKVKEIIREYNAINIKTIDENYFSCNFKDKFFDNNTAKIIGFIREDLEKRKAGLSEKEFNVLLTTLIYNIDKIANTVGHFDAYIKKPLKNHILQLRLIKPFNIQGIEIHRENANTLVRNIKTDVAYIDPPYNSRQYSRFYHIYENLVTWKKPQLFGVALKPQPENMSVYCTVGAKNAFKDLIENINARYIAVSYNNTYNSKSSSSENKISLEDIEAILKRKGQTEIFESSHRFFNTGKTEFNNHKELLFFTKTDEKK